MKNKLNIAIFVFINSINYSYSQPSIDSLILFLKFKISTSKDDTTKVNYLNKISEQLWRTSIDDSALTYAINAKNIANKINFKKGIAESYNNIGNIYTNQTNYPEAIKNHFEALKLREEIEDKKGMAGSFNNIGVIYEFQGIYPKALKMFYNAIKINEKISNKKWAAINYNNIGIIYTYQGNYSEALKKHLKALKLNSEIRDKQGIADTYNNLGNIYQSQKNYSDALKNYFVVLKITEEVGNKIGMAYAYNNIGTIYFDQAKSKETSPDSILNKLENALNYYLKALTISEKIGNKRGVAGAYLNIGAIELELNNLTKAKLYLNDALALARETGYKELLKKCYLNFSILDSTTGTFKDAYTNYKYFSFYKDSLFSEEKSKEIGRLEMRHEFEMEELERNRIVIEKLKVEQEKTYRRNKLQYNGILLGLTGLFIIIFLFSKSVKKINANSIAKSTKQSQSKKLLINLPHLSKIYTGLIHLPNYLKLVESMMFIYFLILFEFILVLLDPYIEQYTGGAPLWKLLCNSLLATIIFLLHDIFEAKLKNQVVKKNGIKKIINLNNNNSEFKTLLFIGGFFFISFLNFSFSENSDPLINNLQIKNDTGKVNKLNKLAWEIKNFKPDTALICSKQAFALSEKLNWKNGKAASLHNLGTIEYLKGNYSKSLTYCLKAVELWDTILSDSTLGVSVGDIKKSKGATLGTIGVVYSDQGDYPSALKYYFDAMALDSELENKYGISRHLGNIGAVYRNQGALSKQKNDNAGAAMNFNIALNYYFKALKLDRELTNKSGIAHRLGNIGIVYSEQEEYTKALNYFTEALKLEIELNRKNVIAIRLGNIGNVYGMQNDFANAQNYFLQSLKINKEIRDKAGLATDFGNIGSLYVKTGQFEKAIQFLKNALSISDSIGFLNHIKFCHENLYQVYDTLAQLSSHSRKISIENFKFAYNHFKKYSATKDSLFNENKSNEIGRIEQKHEFEVSALENKKIKNEQLKIENKKIDRRNMLQYSGILIGMLFLFILVFFLGKIPIPEWLTKFSTFIPFMILFEFTLVLIEPYIDTYAGGEPLYKLLFNAVCAAIIYPVHCFFEKKLKTRIYEIRRKKEKQFAEEFKKEVDKIG